MNDRLCSFMSLSGAGVLAVRGLPVQGRQAILPALVAVSGKTIFCSIETVFFICQEQKKGQKPFPLEIRKTAERFQLKQCYIHAGQ